MVLGPSSEVIVVDSRLADCDHVVGFRTRLSSASKRAFDLVLALPLLLVLFPGLLIVALAVAVFLGRPIFFRQERPGFRGKPFVMVKFRTMTDERGPDGELLPDADRLTPFGRFLRHTSLDELPELYNVIRGEMSLVGPRPLLMRYLLRYSPEEMRRHDVKPGITGWSQINGRNALSWSEKFALDLWYVEHQSIALDIKVLLLTVWKALRCEGITRPGWATTEEFMGGSARVHVSDGMEGGAINA